MNKIKFVGAVILGLGMQGIAFSGTTLPPWLQQPPPVSSPPTVHPAPEIDPAGAFAALTLLAGGLAVITRRRAR
jgi:hypothetical protein